MDEPLPEGYAREQFRVIGGETCDGPYSFEAELRVAPFHSAGGGGGGGGSMNLWVVAGVAGAVAWLWRRKQASVSRRQFVALLAAGGAAAAMGASGARESGSPM